VPSSTLSLAFLYNLQHTLSASHALFPSFSIMLINESSCTVDTPSGSRTPCTPPFHNRSPLTPHRQHAHACLHTRCRWVATLSRRHRFQRNLPGLPPVPLQMCSAWVILAPQVTGPVARLAREIAGEGCVQSHSNGHCVLNNWLECCRFITVCPESFHEFEAAGTALR
jgi:hypothetical protein